MKKTLLPLVFGLVMTSVAQAGPDPMPAGKEIILPPPPTCLWTWFAGASIGQLDEWDEDIYNLQVGVERKCSDANCSHAIYLEVGYTEKDAGLYIARDLAYSYDVPYGQARIEAEIIPITINYKYECAVTGNLNWYIGAGAGAALVDLTGKPQQGTSSSFDDTTFYAHAFAGLTYNFNESFEAFVGARYIWMNDPELTGVKLFDSMVSLDDDWFYELGFRIMF